MTLLEKFLAEKKSARVETVTVTVSSMSNIQDGEYGDYRFVIIDGKECIIDDRKILHSEHFTPGCSATITMKEFEKDGKPEISVIGLTFSA